MTRNLFRDICLLFAQACGLTACSTIPPGGYTQSPEASQALAEFPEVARKCELPQATLAQFTDEGTSMRLLLPADIYGQRDEPVTRGRIGCIQQWANERALRLTVMGTER